MHFIVELYNVKSLVTLTHILMEPQLILLKTVASNTQNTQNGCVH